MNPMLTVKDVAALFGVTIDAVYRLAHKPGGLTAYKIGGNIRFKREDVEAYLEASVIKPAVKEPHPIQTRFKYVPGMRVV